MITGNVVNEKRVLVLAFHISLSNFFFGYNLGVFNSCLEYIAYSMGWDNSSKDLYSNIFSTFIPVGAFFGASITGHLCNSLGRRNAIIFMDLILIIGSCLSSIPSTVPFGIGRFIVGFSVGICLSISPMYVGEITPQQMMFKTGPIITLMMAFGITVGYAFGLILPTDNFQQPLNNI